MCVLQKTTKTLKAFFKTANTKGFTTKCNAFLFLYISVLNMPTHIYITGVQVLLRCYDPFNQRTSLFKANGTEHQMVTWGLLTELNVYLPPFRYLC